MLISRLGFVLCYNFIMKSIQVFDKLKDIFNKAGYRLFIIGGTSRDLLLGREINDFDFVTDATPEQEKEFLLGANFAFAQYGAISIKIDDNKCDIVTLRKENSYSDGRHPDNIEFIKDINEDYKRRDFTINAIYIDENYNVIDPSNGVADLNSKTIRVIGSVKQRIDEDPLRMLRAYRFAITLDFDLESELKEYIIANSHLLKMIRKEKIEEEFKKLKKHIK